MRYARYSPKSAVLDDREATTISQLKQLIHADTNTRLDPHSVRHDDVHPYPG